MYQDTWGKEKVEKETHNFVIKWNKQIVRHWLNYKNLLEWKIELYNNILVLSQAKDSSWEYTGLKLWRNMSKHVSANHNWFRHMWSVGLHFTSSIFSTELVQDVILTNCRLSLRAQRMTNYIHRKDWFVKYEWTPAC